MEFMLNSTLIQKENTAQKALFPLQCIAEKKLKEAYDQNPATLVLRNSGTHSGTQNSGNGRLVHWVIKVKILPRGKTTCPGAASDCT